MTGALARVVEPQKLTISVGNRRKLHAHRQTRHSRLARGLPGRGKQVDRSAIVETNADVAEAGYTDSLETARALDEAIQARVDNPTEETLTAARQAWVDARVHYQQTELYRFGNPIVDDWEGRVNAWPLDEGLIDYVAPTYGTESDINTLYTANVIANDSVELNGETVDTSEITPALLQDQLQEAGGVEANVPPAITPSNSCYGARTSTGRMRARARAPPPTSPPATIARTAIATAAPNT